MNISNDIIIAFGSILAFIVFMNIISMVFFRTRSGYTEKKNDTVLATRFLTPLQSRA